MLLTSSVWYATANGNIEEITTIWDTNQDTRRSRPHWIPNLHTTAMPESCNSCRPMTVRTQLVGILAAATVAGCAASDDASGRFLVQPDRYQLYSCRELAEAAQAVGARQLELEGLMAKAGPDASGHFVSTIAYRPEYLQLRGQMNEIRKTSAEKKCKFSPDAASGARGSDQIIR